MRMPISQYVQIGSCSECGAAVYWDVCKPETSSPICDCDCKPRPLETWVSNTTLSGREIKIASIEGAKE